MTSARKVKAKRLEVLIQWRKIIPPTPHHIVMFILRRRRVRRAMRAVRATQHPGGGK